MKNSSRRWASLCSSFQSYRRISKKYPAITAVHRNKAIITRKKVVRQKMPCAIKRTLSTLFLFKRIKQKVTGRARMVIFVAYFRNRRLPRAHSPTCWWRGVIYANNRVARHRHMQSKPYFFKNSLAFLF